MIYNVSVIIPTFNRVEFLREAIESVLNQTYPVTELIIVDDASTDKTEQLVRSIKSENTEIIYLKNKRNMGVSHSRNRGIKQARSEFIALLDSDDLWIDNKLDLQLQSFRENPKQLFCHTNEKWLLNGRHKNQSKHHLKQSGYFFERCLERCLVSPSSVLIKKQVFENFAYFDEELTVCEDYDLWLRYQLHFPFHFIDEILVIKRGGHPDQLSKHATIDYFRIMSLKKIVQAEQLNDEQFRQTLSAIHKKNKILQKGAVKHSNKELLGFCMEIENFISELSKKLDPVHRPA
ncbi:MAG: glycosyltransferase [Calditrichaeota bacterium]|nr:glycosyltransferase [Calditrichota bacterium]